MCAPVCAGSGTGVPRGLPSSAASRATETCAQPGASEAEVLRAAAEPAGWAGGRSGERKARRRRGAGGLPRGRVELALEAALVTGGRPLPPGPPSPQMEWSPGR